MSGIASDASTTPGSVATLASCSSERSRSIAASNSSSANNLAGTRIPATAPTGISHSSSSTRITRNSDIEHHACQVPARRPLEDQAVVGDGLDDRRRLPEPAGDGCLHRVCRELQTLELRAYEPFRLGKEHELLHPARQQCAAVRCVCRHLSSRARAGGGSPQLPQRGEGIGENFALTPRLACQCERGGGIN